MEWSKCEEWKIPCQIYRGDKTMHVAFATSANTGYYSLYDNKPMPDTGQYLTICMLGKLISINSSKIAANGD